MQGVMIRSASRISADVLAAAPQLAIVGRAGVGVDNVDLPAATEHGVVVVNSPEGNTVAAAEQTLALLLAMVRHTPMADASLKAGRWDRKAYTGSELFGKTLGLIGLGKIGSRVAKACQAMGMKLVVYDPFIAPELAESLGVTLLSLNELWPVADFITVHVPKTKETTHLINATTLAQCKAGVRLVNCARGGIIEEAALADALRSGHVAAAALDVFEQEPLENTSPLLAEDLAHKLILTPHLGASTEEAQVNVALDVAEQIRDFLTTGAVRSAVNLPLLRSDLLDPVRPFMPLVENLAKVLRQLASGPATQLEIRVKGALTEKNLAPLSLAALKGLLSQNREGVTYVNAPLLAKAQGLVVSEVKVPGEGSFANLVTLVLHTPQGQVCVAGTLLGNNLQRIVDLDGFKASLKPTAHMLMVPHEDKPGMVAKVATVLGDAGINIASLQVGQKLETQANASASVMIFNLEAPVPAQQLQAITAIEGCFGATLLQV